MSNIVPKNDLILSGRKRGKSHSMATFLGHFMENMKPGEKLLIMTSKDTMTIERNAENVEVKADVLY